MHNNAVYALLVTASFAALGGLSNALEVRDSNIGDKLEDLRSRYPDVRAAGLQAIAALANRLNHEGSIARDFCGILIAHLDVLDVALAGRYCRAQFAIRQAKRLRSTTQAQAFYADVFTYYLTAVCDMSGPKDEDN